MSQIRNNTILKGNELLLLKKSYSSLRITSISKLRQIVREDCKWHNDFYGSYERWSFDEDYGILVEDIKGHKFEVHF